MRKMAFATVLVAVSVAAAGCGGSKKSSAPAPTPSTTVPTHAVTTTTPAATTTESSGGTTTTSGIDTTGLTGHCADFAGTAAKLSEAFGSSSGSAADVDKLKLYFAELTDKAPSDIKSSFATLADAITKYADLVKGIDIKPGQTPSADQLQKLQQGLAKISAPAVKQASDKIQAWVKAGCH